MKKIKIDEDLFFDICHFFIDTQKNNQEAQNIIKRLSEKIRKMIAHEEYRK